MEIIELLATNRRQRLNAFPFLTTLASRYFIPRHFVFLVILKDILYSHMDVSVRGRSCVSILLSSRICVSAFESKFMSLQSNYNTLTQSRFFTPRTLFVISYKTSLMNSFVHPFLSQVRTNYKLFLQATAETVLFNMGIPKCRPNFFLGKLILAAQFWYPICIHNRSVSRGHVNVILTFFVFTCTAKQMNRRINSKFILAGFQIFFFSFFFVTVTYLSCNTYRTLLPKHDLS